MKMKKNKKEQERERKRDEKNEMYKNKAKSKNDKEKSANIKFLKLKKIDMHINKIINKKQKCEKIQTYYGTYEKYIKKNL